MKLLHDSLLAVVVLLTAAACEAPGSSTPPGLRTEAGLTTCAPNEYCTDSLCTCAATDACSPEGVCVPATACVADCAGAGFACGSLCDTSCGTCSGAEMCFAGTCLGPSAVSCLSCSLRLALLSKESNVGLLTEVTLAVDYLPADGEPRPRMADLRLVSNRQVTPVAATTEPGLSDANKSLYVDPVTQAPFRRRADGSIQFLALAIDNTNRFVAGRLLTATVTLSSPSAAFWLEKRQQTLAPPEADQAIFATDYNAPLVVIP